MSHTCVRKNSKGPPKYFCPFLLISRVGGGDTCGEWGRIWGLQPAFFTRVLGERWAIRRGGGTQAHINPLPQAAITIETPITHAPTTQNIFSLKVQCWPRVSSHAPPPMRTSCPPPMFLCSVISECLYEVHYEVRCWLRAKNFWSSVHCLYSL